MQILLTYDISSQHELVKNKLMELGYEEGIEGTNGILNLPETTLYKEFIDNNEACEEAIQDIKQIVGELNVDLIRVIAVDFENWSGIIGKPYHREGQN